MASMEMHTNIFLHSGQLNDTFINSALRNEPVHCHLTRLAESMSTVHSLRVI